ncbi:hypothetical protein D3C73_1656060 [compost metagenome]
MSRVKEKEAVSAEAIPEVPSMSGGSVTVPYTDSICSGRPDAAPLIQDAGRLRV